MGTYAYEAMNSSGQEVKDEIEANTTEEAIAKIRGKGYFPTKVREKAQKKLSKKKQSAAGDTAPLQTKRKMPISIGGVPDELTWADTGTPGISTHTPKGRQTPATLSARIGDMRYCLA